MLGIRSSSSSYLGRLRSQCALRITALQTLPLSICSTSFFSQSVNTHRSNAVWIVSILLSAGGKTIASKVWVSPFLFPKPHLHSVWSFYVNVNCLHCRFVWYKSATSNAPRCSQHSSLSLHFSRFACDLLNTNGVCNQRSFWGRKSKVMCIGGSFTKFGF